MESAFASERVERTHDLPLRTIGRVGRDGRMRDEKGRIMKSSSDDAFDDPNVIAVREPMGEASGSVPATPRPPASIPAGFKPVRVWTGGPGSSQEKIVRPGTIYGIKPRVDGSYLMENPEDVALVKAALGGRYWPDDIPSDADSIRCDECGWTTRSYRAYQWHSNNAHGRAQAS